MQNVTIRDASTNSSATILIGLGFNCYEWIVEFDDGPRDLLWAEEGFADGKLRPSASGIPLLFPFPGRIGQGEFEYGGKTYLVNHDASRAHALHGFILNRPWRLVDLGDSHVTAAFQASIDDPGILNQWPSDFAVQATYRLAGRELQFEATFANTGYDPLPWAFGTHAYFRVPLASGSDLADTVLTAPVDAEWLMDDMLPTGELAELPADLTLDRGVRLGDRQFDTPYRLAKQTGLVETLVADPTSGRQVVQSYQSEDYPCAVIYTPGHREALCIEPYTCIPDPFRLEASGIDTGLRTLAPGDSHTTNFVLRAEG